MKYYPWQLQLICYRCQLLIYMEVSKLLGSLDDGIRHAITQLSTMMILHPLRICVIRVIKKRPK